MNSRERWLASINHEPVDRFTFWPKLDGAYPKAQIAPFNKMSISEIHEWIGSEEHFWLPACFREIRKKTSTEIYKDAIEKMVIYNTSIGSTKSRDVFDISSQASHPVEMPIKNVKDIKIMTEWYSDVQIEIDKDMLEKAGAKFKQIGSSGIAGHTIGESPLMYFLEWLAGIENGHYLIMDYRTDVMELFDAIHRTLLRKTELLCEYSPADLLYFIENTSTTLISPEQFRSYCFKHIEEYGQIIKQAGRKMGLHMCGQLKDLLPDLSKSSAAVFEAFTSPTVGNTSLFDGRSKCPDKCLIGGTNATLWIQDTESIIAKLKEDLDILPHHRGIVISSGGVMPPLCKPETIKEVCDWLKNYKLTF